MKRASTTVALLFAASACTPARTEVLIVVDTDFVVPEELDEVRIDLIGPGGETRRAEGSIQSAADLPRTLGVVDATNREMRSVRATVTGLLRGANVVQRRAVFTFVPRETRILRMDLLRACAGVGCASDQTCAENGCRSAEIAAVELVPYEESRVDRLDAAVDLADAGSDAGCIFALEACNELDDDCDGHVDEDFTLAGDLDHCGSCDNACSLTPVNASSVCLDGACGLACDRAFADCNGLLEDGCEGALTSRAHCGVCGEVCFAPSPFCADGPGGPACVESCPIGTVECDGACADLTSDPLRCGGCTSACPAPDNASATCTGSACGFECDPGFANCDGDAANGCESSLHEEANCGRCGQRCERPDAIVSCASGVCETLGCAPRMGDCDGDAVDGCETDLSSDAFSCGACGTECVSGPNASARCEEGQCVLACAPDFANCDGRADNGCEQSLASPSACGACGIACGGGAPFCTAVAGGFACASGCTGASDTLCGGSCTDTASDPLNCGACDMRCPVGVNARAGCAMGECELACNVGWGDCDREPANGCESFLAADARHCGRCGNDCSAPPYAIAVCTSGACSYRCEPGWEDCNGMPGDGCETNIGADLTSCGSCGNRCALGSSVRGVSCNGGLCMISTCDTARADCDASFTTGCEVDIQQSRLHCGGCGTECASGQRCCGGVCLAPADCP